MGLQTNSGSRVAFGSGRPAIGNATPAGASAGGKAFGPKLCGDESWGEALAPLVSLGGIVLAVLFWYVGLHPEEPWPCLPTPQAKAQTIASTVSAAATPKTVAAGSGAAAHRSRTVVAASGIARKTVKTAQAKVPPGNAMINREADDDR